MMNLSKLEQEHQALIRSLSVAQTEVPIYFTRKQNPEVDMRYIVEHPKNPDVVLHYDESLTAAMKWCEKNSLRYKYKSNTILNTQGIK